MCCSAVDVHKSLQSALMILGHKIRHKEIQVSKTFGADVPILESAATGLHQVWMNLLDNAVDAAPQRGHITVRTWAEGHDVSLVSVGRWRRNSGGKSTTYLRAVLHQQARGSGHWTGTEHRVQNCDRTFWRRHQFESEPGKTEFVVQPAAAAAGNRDPGRGSQPVSSRFLSSAMFSEKPPSQQISIHKIQD